MEDVAAASGMSRTTVYRYVSSREELIELSLMANVRELGERLQREIDVDAPDLRASFVDALIASIKVTRENVEFGYLAEAIGRVELAQTLAGESDVHETVASTLQPLIDRARNEGLLRTDVSEHELVAWIQGTLVTWTPRVDLDYPALHRAFEKFLLPAVFSR